MVLDNIEKLIEKYDNGETTLQEEQQLKSFFSQETVPAHLEVYKTMFMFFASAQKEEFKGTIPLKTRKTNRLYQWISVAAVAILMVGMYFTIQTTNTDPMASLTEEERRDLYYAQEVFDLMSQNFRKGTEKLATMNHLSESFDKGTDQIVHLGEFDDQVNKIFKD